MQNIYIPFLLAIVVGLIEFVTKQMNLGRRDHLHKIISFSAGISITYLLLELLPLFTEAAFSINRILFVALLLGFISHHLVEKEIYKHNKSHELVKMLTLEEHVFYFIYHVSLGTVLVTFTQENIVSGLLLFFSILAFTTVSNLPALPHKNVKKAFFLSSSTLVGVIIATSFWWIVPTWVHFSLVGFAAGVLLFTVTRHHIPFGRKGRIGYFSFAFILYSALILLSWLL